MDNGLTPREQDVLGLVAGGCGNAEVARSLYVSVATVKTHVRSILRKTGCANRVQLIALVYRQIHYDGR
jgi:DNA-binding NarL/FixJ family response regulator